MSVGNYRIDMTVDGKEISVIQEGYLSLTQNVETFPWMRVKDINGVTWQINNKKISTMKITKCAEEPEFKTVAMADEED